MKSRRPKVALDAIPQLSHFGLLAERPTCREPRKGNCLYPRNCLISFEKSRGTNIQFAANWTPPHYYVQLHGRSLVRPGGLPPPRASEIPLVFRSVARAPPKASTLKRRSSLWSRSFLDSRPPLLGTTSGSIGRNVVGVRFFGLFFELGGALSVTLLFARGC